MGSYSCLVLSISSRVPNVDCMSDEFGNDFLKPGKTKNKLVGTTASPPCSLPSIHPLV